MTSDERELPLLAVLPTRKPAPWVLSGAPEIIAEARRRGLEVSDDGDTP